jgi:protein-S-isoprenylcysteine O-methyltransferase Ste14
MKRSLLLRVTFQLIVSLLIVMTALFVSAGTLNWPAAWIYVGYTLLVSVLTIYGGPLKISPGLIEERISRKKPGAQAWDRVFVRILLSLTLVMYVVAGLDHRWNCTPPMPGWVVGAGMISITLSVALMIWAMRVNPFFSAIVRLQTDRGHYVVTTGPYRFVRHPGYTGGLLMNIGIPLLLGSLWALIPGIAASLDLIIRIIPEDRFLHRELEGYSDYARRVKWRLMPGVW